MERLVAIGAASGARLTDFAGDRVVGTGVDTFSDVVRDCVFIDKSMLVADVAKPPYGKVRLFCRPRRFGKTLAISMLKAFFECAPAADPAMDQVFQKLAIWEADGGRWRSHCGRYPVVFLSLKTSTGRTWDVERDRFAMAMADEYARHDYLLQSPSLKPHERVRFTRILNGEASHAELESSLRDLVRILARHHGQRCVVLVDEYDAPVTAAYEGGFLGEAVDFMRNWLSDALKTNSDLAFGVLTGVQRISKESIFSGLNNIEVNTPLSTTSDERFGFTPAEVDALAVYMGHAEKTAEVRAWYDGYRFGSTDIFNPWSVLSYFEHGCQPMAYWVNTSGNALVGDLVRRADRATTADLYDLAARRAVEAPIDVNVAFGDLRPGSAAMWGLLYLSGYVTTDDTDPRGSANLPRCLRVPNREVAEVFSAEISERFRAEAGDAVLNDLHAALLSGDAEALGARLCEVLAALSYHDLTDERGYHLFLAGALQGVPRYRAPLSNREAGSGRPDLVLAPVSEAPADLPIVTVELKMARSDAPDELAARAADALAQIDACGYDAPEALAALGIEPGRPRLRWGIACHGKHAACACARLAKQ